MSEYHTRCTAHGEMSEGERAEHARRQATALAREARERVDPYCAASDPAFEPCGACAGCRPKGRSWR